MPVTFTVVPVHVLVALRPETAVALPKGSTENASPQVISPTASPPEDGGLISRSARRPPDGLCPGIVSRGNELR
jgi:hypothetical protein